MGGFVRSHLSRICLYNVRPGFINGVGLDLTFWAVNEVSPLQDVVFSWGIASICVALICNLVIFMLRYQIVFTHGAHSSPTTRHWGTLLVVQSNQ
jgi:hypothetical protein